MMDVIARWTNEAIGITTGGASNIKFTWTPPRREMIDPGTEIAAAKEAIRSGLSSRSEEIRKLGLDPDDLEAEIAGDNERADAAKLIFDTDPRVATSQGALQGKALPKEPKPAPAPAAAPSKGTKA
jgi:capsid protein